MSDSNKGGEPFTPDQWPAMWKKVNGAYVCAPRKCGYTSLLQSVGQYTPSYAHVESKDAVKYLAIRHPVERFISLWRFVRSHPFATAHDNLLQPLAGLSPDALMDYIEANPAANPHWIPQSTYWHLGVTPVPYDRLLEVIGSPAKHGNKSTYAAPETVPEARILRHYAEDMALYKLAAGVILSLSCNSAVDEVLKNEQIH